MSVVEVVGLDYYPIKSCGAVSAGEVTFSEFGIEYDREWLIDDRKGRTLTQRTYPQLALVGARVENGQLIATVPGMDELAVSLERDPDAELVDISLWKKPGTGRDTGADASEFFSDYLHRPARLLRVEQPRAIKPECRVPGATELTAFADGFPLLLGSMASLAALNERLESPVTMDRFRPNITIDGAPAYDEDYWRTLGIGALRAFVVRACARCPIPNIDQAVGELLKERPVTDALRESRRGIDPIGEEKGEFFGQSMVHVFEPGVIVRIGDAVAVAERASKRNWQTAA